MEVKKIVYQGVKFKMEKGNKKISFLAGCVVEEELYFSSWNDRGFYKLNLRTGCCIPLTMFKDEQKGMCLYNQAIYFKNAVWLVPAYGQYVVKINLETLEIKNFDLPQDGKEILGKDGIQYIKFKCCYKDGASEFWLAPIGYDTFLRVDMAENQIREYSELREKVIFENGSINFCDACFVNDEIWLCPWDSKELVIFDTITDEFKFYEWKYAIKGYRKIENYKNQAVFLPWSEPKNILLIAQGTFEEKEISVNVDWENKAYYMYLTANIMDQQIFLVPYQAHEYITIDLETGKVELNRQLHNYVQNMLWGQEQYQGSMKCNRKIIYLSDEKNMPLMVYDIEKNAVSYIEVAVDKEAYKNFLKKLQQKDPEGFLNWVNPQDSVHIMEENLPLEIFCSVCDSLKNEEEYNVDIQKSIGGEILLNAEKFKIDLKDEI